MGELARKIRKFQGDFEHGRQGFVRGVREGPGGLNSEINYLITGRTPIRREPPKDKPEDR